MYIAVEKPGKMEGKILETLKKNMGGRESFTINGTKFSDNP